MDTVKGGSLGKLVRNNLGPGGVMLYWGEYKL
jgi:hypothetical protein